MDTAEVGEGSTPWLRRNETAILNDVPLNDFDPEDLGQQKHEGKWIFCNIWRSIPSPNCDAKLFFNKLFVVLHQTVSCSSSPTEETSGNKPRHFKRRSSLQRRSADPQVRSRSSAKGSPHLLKTMIKLNSGLHSSESGDNARGNVASTNSDSSCVESTNSPEDTGVVAVETPATNSNVQPPLTPPGNSSSAGSGNFFNQPHPWRKDNVGQGTAN